jgi:serine/threonine-protein kinase
MSEESSITQVGSVLGTAAYLAPEQAAGEEAGPAADIYATGVVAYQLLSGRLPYEAASLTELALKQQREVPPPLHHLDPTIPPALGVVVERALALDPRSRWASAEELGAALADGARGIGPDEDATHVGRRDPTMSTTVLPGEPGTGPMVMPRAPRQPRRPAPAAAPPQAAPPAPPRRRDARRDAGPAPARRPRRRGRLRRLIAWIVLLILLAGGGAAAYLATSGGETAVKLRQVVYDESTRVADELQQLIDDNTR